MGGIRRGTPEEILRIDEVRETASLADGDNLDTVFVEHTEITLPRMRGGEMTLQIAQKRIEEYLGTLRAQLRGLKEQDAQEFVEELRSLCRHPYVRLG